VFNPIFFGILDAMVVKIDKILMFSAASVQFGKVIDGDYGQSYNGLVVT